MPTLSLRHTLATLAYRGGKVLRGASPAVPGFSAGPGARTPLAILGHINDLLTWLDRGLAGDMSWQASSPAGWDEEAARFHATLQHIDDQLAAGVVPSVPVERLFQGPIADALTHVGQIALLRRLAGSPVRGENFVRAEVTIGRVGADQPPPVLEFD